MGNPSTKEIILTVTPEIGASQSLIEEELKKRGFLEEYKYYRIIRRSIDARRAPVRVNLSILLSKTGDFITEPNERAYKPLEDGARNVVIVGAGPAGLFAGLKAIELGLKPIIVERGKDVDSRKLDIAAISREGKINGESNYCFGEGGAGTYSDGKLYTRSKKRGDIREVLEILHQFGAGEDILIEAHPHIGSDKLPKIIKNIRNKIIECRGEVRFETKMTGLLLDEEGKRAEGIELASGEKIYGPVFLATGHSARDTVRMLHSKGVGIEAKGLAIGVRLEHPQELIDRIQYHSPKGRGQYLPAAEYSFVDQSEGRGVYSFCMCPGGVIVPAVSSEGQIVVNGMSASARSGRWANSGYVVELHPGDIKGFEEEGPLEMMVLQEALEKKFHEEGDGSLNAPAQRIDDFINHRISKDLPSTSYAPGIHSSDFDSLFPKEISNRLREGLQKIGKRSRGFTGHEGIMLGLESRTSSPVRIPRDKEKRRHIEIEDFYPVGEGAGYAGGIVSSALDGMNSMEAYYKQLSNG
ncbi:MAG: FAD-binding protein [Muribaculaceae bacterium]|nr:FAD-binding protein [Muribaculaceae bacterium]